jgi:translocation and assembly module TamB
VQWNISASADLHGELWRFGEAPDPQHPALLFDLVCDTRDFAILRDFWMIEPQFPVISIAHGAITGQIAIDAQHVRFQHLSALFGQNNRSRVLVDSVTLRTAHDDHFPDVWIQNARGENVNLEDVGHIAAFPLAGMATFTAQGGGPFADPIISGEAHLRDFHYNGLPLGDYDTHAGSPWRMRNMRVDIATLDARAGRSTFTARNSYLDFSRWVMSAGTHIASDNFYLRDYYHMFKFENDPTWELYGGQTMPRCSGSIASAARAHSEVPCVDPSDPYEHDPRRVHVPAGTTTGHIESDVSFVLGRPGDDPGGVMDVELWGRNLYVTGFGEALDHTDVHYHYTWLQRDRGFRGGRQNIDFVRARYAGGTIEASGHIDLGGEMHFVGNLHEVHLPQTAMASASGVGGVLNASGVLEGQPDGQRWNVDGDIRALTAASRNLGDLAFHVRSRPDGTRSNDPHARPPRLYWSASASAFNGAMRLEGGLMVPWRTSSWRDVDGEVHPDWDRDWSHSLVDGRLQMTRSIDLVPLLPARVAARLGNDAHAIVRASIDIDHATLGNLDHADARIQVNELDLGAQGLRLALAPAEQLAACVHDGAYWIEPAAANGFDACEHVPPQILGRAPANHADPAMPPARFVGPEGTQLGISGGGTMAGRLGVTLDGQLDLARLAQLVPGVTWARGTGRFVVRATGDTANPQLRGTFELHDGALAAGMLPDPVEDIDLRVRLDGTNIVLDQAVATFGASAIDLTGGRAHLQGRDLDRLDVPLRIQNLSLVPQTGVEVALDANTRLLWNPGEQLPLFSGDVTLTRVRYTRPVNLSQDQSGETRVSGSDSIETPYDPDNDHVRINLTVHARDTIRVTNNIADAEIAIAENERPFRIAGTDQRLGVLGTLTIPRGRVILPLFRGTDFEITRGRIEFDNPDRIQPNFDVNARTDVRRGGSDVARNQWRVALHAYGTPDRFALDMSSEPTLSREDIVLLLTFGATRAELDQAGAGNVGQAIAVQALASATGIDRTVRQAIPVIDDFRIGSAYSPSQGRTVPQVAIGRRINDRVRVGATVNTTEQREMRATVDVTVTNHTSVQLGYDNINDQGSSQIGNLGADLRWRLEFER